MTRTGRLAAWITAAALIWLCAGEISAFGGFGGNKVRYSSFKWQKLSTEHFEIYYYEGEERLAYEMCEIAEKAWQRQMEFFGFMKPPLVKIPIFLYATYHDFIQTNVTPEPLGEGIGGFTEVFKNRIVLPLSASREQRITVVTHELAHASQFILLYGEGMKSYNLYKSVMIPLWFVEGSAEHVSSDWDAMGEMVLRDAVLYDRVPPLRHLHHFNHLEPHDGYLGYKAGQSAVDLIVERYGEEKIARILRNVDQARTFPQVFEEQTGVSLEDFSKSWEFHLKETYWSQVKGKKDPSDYGPALVASRNGNTMINNGPSLSPADDTMAFLSDRQGFRNVFVLKEGKRKPRALFRNGRFDTLFSSPPAWSPDGKRLAVVVKKAERSVILIADQKNGKGKREMKFPLLDIAQPRYSPEGVKIAFSGFDGLAAEIFVADIESGEWRAVTADGESNTHPVFAPDGERIFYASESEGTSYIKYVDLVSARGAKAGFLGGEKRIKGNRPDVSPDGKWILYDSAESGIPNLYVSSPDGKDVRRLTDIRTGIFGGRWTRDGRSVVAVVQESGCQNIYKVKDAMMKAVEVPPPASAEKGAAPKKKAPSRLIKDIPASRLSPPRREFTGSSSTASRRTPGLVEKSFGAASGFFSGRAIAAESGAEGRPVLKAASRRAERRTLPIPLTAVLRDPVVVLSWSPAPIEAAVSYYEVYRSTGTGKGKLLSTIAAGGTTAFRDTGWRYSEDYRYRVRAVDAKGRVAGEGEVPFRADVEITRSEYRLELESRLVDLFVFVGSVYIGTGTSFAGYGAVQLSDLPGDNRLFLEANAIPGWTSLYGISYEYGGLRPDLSVSFEVMKWSRFVLVQSYLSTESFRYPPILTGIRSGSVRASYPLDRYHRVEAAMGAEQFTEVFTDSTGLIETDRKTSRLFPVSAAMVRDTSRWRRLLPSGGGRLRMQVTQTMPFGSSALRLTEYTGEIQSFMGFAEEAALALRWWGAVSQGRNKRYMFLGGRYSLRAHPVASQQGNGAILGNHEMRFNMLEHLNMEIPFLPILFTDVQGVAFYDVGRGFDTSKGLSEDDFRYGSVGAGLNFIGFVFQSAPVLFAVEIARRTDEHQHNPTVYGRLGPLF